MLVPAYLLFTILILHGLCESTASGEIPEVRVRHMEVLDNFGFVLRWDPIVARNGSDPVIGIKVKVWRTPCVTKTVFHHDGENVTKIVKSERVKFNSTSIPQELPEQVFIVTADEESCTVPRVDPEVWYHVRVLAFTSREEGPYSSPVQFKINTGDDEDKKKSCERIISQILVEDDYGI